jgi:Domain of unknown function (DUF4292)
MLGFFISSCVTSKPTEDVELLPAERLVSKLESNRRKIVNFEGSGTIHVSSTTLNNSASFQVILVKPDSIYLTIMGPFGIDLAQALVTKSDFVFYDALKNVAYKGKVDDSILENIFKIDLPFSDLIDAFVGSVNLTDRLYKSPDKYDVQDDDYVLTYSDSALSKETIYKVSIKDLGITNYQVIDHQNLILEGKYSQFGFISGVALPYHIEITNKRENQTVIIDYKNMKTNNSNIFIDFKLPKDATVIRW